MKKQLTQAEIEKRFTEINALEPEEPTLDEVKSLTEAEAMDDGTTITLNELKNELEEYSGKLNLRIPRSLHRALKKEAEAEGVSLNQFMLYKLSR